ncbi:4'-phosphopantetheinyl transferase superfamily protein [Streptomyces sp. NPDC051921]|uniref:4'-phosphopantetheinyl transferase family protein n=1 Tax=Streptomyces sp. NPDC051921 TaxID=3155806 RepID=UPI0034189036
MLQRILPHCVAVAEARDDPPEARLYPEEAALVSRAEDGRRREFTTVRHCARQAMARLGVPTGPVLPGRHGAPRWPGRTVGSLTHCDGYRGAALARDTDVLMLGIDAERHAPLPPGILEAIALPQELRRVSDHRARHGAVHWDRLLFSAKEAVYKAWNPHTGQRLEFEEADIAFDPDAGTFTARLLAPPPAQLLAPPPAQLPAPPTGAPALPDRLDGRWTVDEGLILTAIAVPTPR